MDIKERFYGKLNEAREQLDEVGDTQKGVSKLLKVQKRAMKRSFAEKDPKKAAKHMKVANQAYMKLPVALGEEEQLNELRGKGTLDKKDKEKLQKRIRDKHDKAWNETQEIRKEKKSKGSEDTKHMDKFRNRLAKMHNKLDEEQLNELRGKGALEKIRDYHTNRRNKAKSNAERIINDTDDESPKTIHWNNEVGKHNAHGAAAERAKSLIQHRDKKKSDKKDKLFLRSRKMIAVSKLDRNRKRNKNNRQD